MERVRCLLKERRWSQEAGRPEASSRAAKRREMERIQAMEDSVIIMGGGYFFYKNRHTHDAAGSGARATVKRIEQMRAQGSQCKAREDEEW